MKKSKESQLACDGMEGSWSWLKHLMGPGQVLRHVANPVHGGCGCTAFCLCFAGLALFAHPGRAQNVVASDNADNSAYAPQPNPNWTAINGGFGYGMWTRLGGAIGGGTYMEGTGVNNQQVEGNYSFALNAGSGSYALSRPLANSLSQGEFTVLTRFDVAGIGPNLVGLRAGNSTSSFGAGELLAFGLVNTNELCYVDASGLHTLASGDARGLVWSWDVTFDAVAGTYTSSVTNLGGGFGGVFNGALQGSGTNVGSFAIIDSSAGLNQNLIFDIPTFRTNNPIPPPLTLNCSSNITVTATCSGGATVFYNSSASGGCNPPPSLSCTPPSGSTFAIGTTTVICTAYDSCGDTTNCSFMITVTPPAPPPPLVLNCSSNITVTANGPSGGVVFYNSSASGGCNPPPSLWCTPPSGSTFPIGTTTVTCTASDTCGDITNCSFMITVTPPPPPPPLVLNCSSNITVNANSICGATVFYNSSASGGCNPPPSLSCTPPSGSTFPVGTTTVICTAYDSCGDTTNCSFTITVNPPAPPPPLVLNCSSNITVTANGPSGAVVFYNSSAGGGCNPPPSLWCTPPSGSTFPIGTTTVICTASDSCGDSTNCSFTVTVLAASPTLRAARGGNSVMISWSATLGGFMLEQNDSPNNPAGWTNFDGTIVDDGTNNSTVITPSRGALYFRLKK